MNPDRQQRRIRTGLDPAVDGRRAGYLLLKGPKPNGVALPRVGRGMAGQVPATIAGNRAGMKLEA